MDEHVYDDLIERLEKCQLRLKVVDTEKCFIEKPE
jgi:hypothetical protein